MCCQVVEAMRKPAQQPLPRREQYWLVWREIEGSIIKALVSCHAHSRISKCASQQVSSSRIAYQNQCYCSLYHQQCLTSSAALYLPRRALEQWQKLEDSIGPRANDVISPLAPTEDCMGTRKQPSEPACASLNRCLSSAPLRLDKPFSSILMYLCMPTVNDRCNTNKFASAQACKSRFARPDNSFAVPTSSFKRCIVQLPYCKVVSWTVEVRVRCFDQSLS